MNLKELLNRRMYNTGLSYSPFQTAAAAVSHLGAVQAQDYTAAKWALGLRARDSGDGAIERAFNDGRILRMHILRPTWHFVLPEDIRWMLDLTVARVKSHLAASNRKLGLDEVLFAKTNAAIVNALDGHNYLTRQELDRILDGIGIKTDVQRLAHIIMQAELDGLICSGPRRGKQFTYALLEERVPGSNRLDPKQSLAELARRYFTSHGPAQLKDFAWWSGLATKEASEALERVKTSLEQVTCDARTFWSAPQRDVRVPDSPRALLLSLYDEYTIAYRDRSDISGTREIERMISRGNAFSAVIIVNGRVAGAWRRAVNGQSIEIRLHPFRDLDDEEQEAVEAEVARYGKFFGIPSVLAEGI